MTKTTCPYFGVGCGVLAGADGTIKGDPDHPANFGRLCSKGATLGETIDLEGSLLAPTINGQDADWDTALDLVATQFSDAILDHGPDSVAFCVTGHDHALGTDTVPGTYADLEEADLIVLVGSNLAWSHLVLHKRIAAAKAARPTMKIINIEPRRGATTDLADVHLQITQDGDIALFNGLLAHRADTHVLDLEYIHDRIQGCHDSVRAARKTDPRDVGITVQKLRRFYRLWATTPNVVTIYSKA